MRKIAFSRVLLPMILAVASPPVARAEVFTTVNGLPCGEFCRSWMGIEATRTDNGRKTQQRSVAHTERRAVPASQRTQAEARVTTHPHPRLVAHAHDGEAKTAGLLRDPNPTGAIEPPAVASVVPSRQVDASPSKPPVETKLDEQPPEPANRPASEEQTATTVPQQAAEAPASHESDAVTEKSVAPTKEVEPTPKVEPEKPLTSAEAETGAPAPEANKLVLIVLVKPEIKSASDLHDQTVAVTGLSDVSMDVVKAAFASAGANKVVFKPGETASLASLVSGEVAAFVVDAESPAAASQFPDISGFRVIRVPVVAQATP